ncbi:GIY-YIG nuclease family protein [Rhodohalobacter halophilus]|uniref:GIY-YIG nuclease family protein n=1 Tax=Rhodohalobacter halophilus TaxID=1812810 RepID=UPI00083F9159|nr:GIY-YIG nuclease family protein [Rhodohalobacter halophilus]
MSYYVYILYSVSVDRYFVGQTSNLENQLKRHNEGKNKYTKSGIPWKLMYQEGFDERAEAMSKEEKIKSSESREQLRRYIESGINELNRC